MTLHLCLTFAAGAHGESRDSSPFGVHAQLCKDDGLWYSCGHDKCTGLRACASNKGLLHCACRDDTAGFPSYTNWNAGEPNNYGGNEHCLLFYSSGKWNDDRCTTKRKYVCQTAPPPAYTPQYDDTHIESCINGRFLFETSDSGDITSTRGNEGGWIGVNNTPVVTADTDYYGRAQWRLVPLAGGEWLIASSLTGRYLFETSDSGDIRSIRGNEGTWVGVYNKPVVTADMDYDDLAKWRLVPIRAGQYRIESSVTGRYLFETSHLNNKPVVTADEDYYNLACWKVTV